MTTKSIIEVPKTPTPETWELGTLQTFMDQTPWAPDWLIEPFIPGDALVMVSGPMKRGRKSLWAIYQSLYLAIGRSSPPARVPMKKNVAYLLNEGAIGETQNRMIGMLRGMGLEKAPDNFFFDFQNPIRLDDDAWVDAIIKQVKEKEIDLVVLDSWYQFYRGLDENSAKDMGLVTYNTNRIRREARTSVLYIHHTGKGKKGHVDDRARGSSVLAAFHDVHHGLSHREGDSSRYLDIIYRGCEDASYQLEWNFSKKVGGPTTLALSPHNEASILSEAKQRAKEVLVPGRPLSKAGVLKKVLGDKAPEKIKEIVWEALELEEIVKARMSGWELGEDS